jgi:hypothetical protein
LTIFSDENDKLMVFSFNSMAITVNPLMETPSMVVSFPDVATLSAGVHSLPSAEFRLISPKSEIKCSKVVFDYSASLFCTFLNGSSQGNVPFFPRGNSSNGPVQSESRGRTRASCNFFVGGWTLLSVGICQIRVHIPVLAISASTPSFSVNPGPAVSGNLVGVLPSEVSGASVIWSSNSSGVPCIVVQLWDAFNNPASQEKFLLSAFLHGTGIPYLLTGETSAQTDSGGFVQWCNIFTTVVASQFVHLHASGSRLNWSFPTLINVSLPGIASVLSAKNIVEAMNSTTPILPGQSLPTITFSATDSAGNTASSKRQSVVIRLRVVRVSNNLTAKYVRFQLGFLILSF